MPKHSYNEHFSIIIDTLNIRFTHAQPVTLDLTQLHPSTALSIYKQGLTTLTLLNPEQRHKSYHLSYSVEVDGKRIGTIDSNPVRATYAANMVHFRTTNQLLYTSELLSSINRLIADFNLVLNNYSRIDIAIDTNVDVMKRFEKYFFDPEHYHFHRNKTQIDKINTFGTVERNGETNYTLYLANNVNGRSLKLYNKSIEIVESSKKHYITEFHRNNGLNINQDIWRFELSITNDAISEYEIIYRLKTDYNSALTEYRYNKLTPSEQSLYASEKHKKGFQPSFDRLQDATHLLELFKHYGYSLVEFRKKDNCNKTRCTPMPLLHLPNDIKPIEPIEYIITTTKHTENTMKHNIKFQFEQFQKWNDADYLTMAQKIAIRNNLMEYYDTLYSKYKSVISSYNHSLGNYNNNSASLF